MMIDTRGMAIALVACLVAGDGLAAPAVVETDPLTPQEQRTRFQLPEGFEIQLVAAEPMIQKPMNMAFDGRGRLWVTHSVEYPFAAAADATPRDGLTVLDDFGPDGRARRATRFADDLNIPIGVLPLACADADGRGQSAIVWSIPHIWRLTDVDGDGRADERRVLYGPFAFDDTHGNQNAFRLGADGWIYANHGFKNHSRVKLGGEGAEVLELQSGNGYRFRPDGSAIEQVSWGQINPFGMDFDALGNRFNADCHSRPLTMLLRGGRYMSPFGPRNADYDDGLGPAPDTTADGHGSTGICAVAICDTARMPPDFQGSVFVGNVVTNQVHRDPVRWTGSSPWVERPEAFLGCDDGWFRPVDLAIGPDGALYVADFYNCIIGHYEVDLKHPRRDRERGRIWRVAWKDAGPPADLPDLTRLPAADLAARLDAPIEPLRRLAFEQVVERGRTDPSLAATLRVPAAGAHRRARSLLALGRMGRLDEATIQAAAADESRLVRVSLLRAAEALPVREPAHDRLFRHGLADADPFVRRVAAESLAARPTIDAVPDMLSALRAASSAADDPQLLHALRMALAAALRSASPERLASLPVAEADRRPLLDIVAGLPGPVLAGYGLTLARFVEAPGAALERVCRSVARHADAAILEEATGFARSTCGDDVIRSAAVIRAILDGAREADRSVGGQAALAGWSAWLLHTVVAMPTATRPSDDVLRTAVAVAERFGGDGAFGLVLAALRDPARPVDLRRVAAAAALTLDREPAVAALATRLEDSGESAAAREEFVRQLAGIGLPRARDAIARTLTLAPAAEQRALAFAALADREAAEGLLGLVARGKVSARVLQDPQIVRRIRDVGATDAEARIGRLTSGLVSPDERVRGLIERVGQRVAAGAGSAEGGAALFARHCTACHRHAGTGGLVGPQLDGVGLRGPERLLEDILDPNRNVDEAFRTTVAMLVDGRVVSGLRGPDAAAEIVLVDVGGREVRVARDEVEETTLTPLSPMPANLADILGEDALADLIAHLRRAPDGSPIPTGN